MLCTTTPDVSKTRIVPPMTGVLDVGMESHYASPLLWKTMDPFSSTICRFKEGSVRI